MPRKNNTQERILEFIHECARERGYPPTVREICTAVGLASTSTVHGHLERLTKKGLLRRDAFMPRAMEITDENFAPKGTVSVPVVGNVAAGTPITAIENIEERILIPEHLTGKSDCFILNIRGDSMIDIGMLDGDMVVVRKQSSVENGEIAVALVDGEATIKRFYREKGHFRLQPENSSMEPIIVKDCEVQGKAVALLRIL